uniref:Uncharacterized protein n=1 Tax=Ananas comosus var. bracteatus TaxID=296719 RepID=A0A6V7NJC0_ANACO|nr:unnamed protein product [Ananas comosus var. bracteatus]
MTALERNPSGTQNKNGPPGHRGALAPTLWTLRWKTEPPTQIWKLKTPEKVKNFVCLVLRKKVLAVDNLASFGPGGSSFFLGWPYPLGTMDNSSHPRVTFGGTGSHVSGAAARGEGVTP